MKGRFLEAVSAAACVLVGIGLFFRVRDLAWHLSEGRYYYDEGADYSVHFGYLIVKLISMIGIFYFFLSFSVRNRVEAEIVKLAALFACICSSLGVLVGVCWNIRNISRDLDLMGYADLDLMRYATDFHVLLEGIAFAAFFGMFWLRLRRVAE